MADDFITDSDSSIFQAKLKVEDLSAEEKLNELYRVAEELAKKVELQKQECESEACGKLDDIIPQVTSYVEENEYNFSGSEKALEQYFKDLFNGLEIETDQEVYKILKEKNRFLAMLQFLANKLKELVKKIFKNDLSFNTRLAKEIEELEDKLKNGELSPEEFARVLERLSVLQKLKFNLQRFVIGWMIATFTKIFAVNLIASIEQESKKEGKEIKRKSGEKSETRIETLNSEKAKKENEESTSAIVPQIKELKIPVLKPEKLDLLLKNVTYPIPQPNFIETQKLKVKEEKKAKSETIEKGELKPASTQPTMRGKPKEKALGYGCSDSWIEMKNMRDESVYRASDQLAQESSIKSSIANCRFHFHNMGVWNSIAQQNHESKFTDMVANKRTKERNDAEISL